MTVALALLLAFLMGTVCFILGCILYTPRDHCYRRDSATRRASTGLRGGPEGYCIEEVGPVLSRLQRGFPHALLRSYGLWGCVDLRGVWRY